MRGEEAQLTFVEFEILSALARRPGRVFTRDMLLTRVWGDSAYRDPRTVDVHIRHLREKIEQRPQVTRSTSSRSGAWATASATRKRGNSTSEPPPCAPSETG